MPNLVQKYTNPEVFRRFRPDLFLAWLKQWEGYFTKRGLTIPPNCGGLGRGRFNPGFHYDGRAGVFMEPTADLPPELVEGLHLVHEMGRPARVASMFEEAGKHG